LTSAAATAALQVDASVACCLRPGAALTDTGIATIAGAFFSQGGLSITGNGDVFVDSPYNHGGGGGLTIGGTLTNSSTNGNALHIGKGNIGAGDTVTATGLVNSGAINILSELMRPTSEAAVEQWLAGQPAASVFISAITEAELRHGLANSRHMPFDSPVGGLTPGDNITTSNAIPLTAHNAAGRQSSATREIL
jgi:hypothetical protein